MASALPLSCHQVIAALVPVLERIGFEREERGFVEIAPNDDHDLLLASWLRWPPEDRYPPGQTIIGGEGVSVWRTSDHRTDGYVNVGIGEMHVRIEWRKVAIDADEFAATVEAFIRRYDGFDPPRYVQEWQRR